MITQNPDYFMTIVQCGNLTRAAEKLFVSQSSLSQYLKRLETSLDVELFDRTVSPMRLTAAGERYYRYIMDLVDQERNMREDLSDLKCEVKGTLKLGIALWRGACLIPDVYPEFHRRYPGVQIKLFEGRFTQMCTALENHEIDLAIANLLPGSKQRDFGFDVIMQERIFLVAPAKNEYIQQQLQHCRYEGGVPLISLDVLEHIPLVLTKEGQSLTEMVNNAVAQSGVKPQILMETGNLTTAINLAAKGVCCAFVPAEGARICQHPGSVQFFAVDSVELSWALAFIYRRNQELGVIRRNFIQCTKEILNP
jgi:DNA-binding transcriptional LysR family regulator